MPATIKVDDASLADLKQAFSQAGERYKKNLARLNKLIEDITSGDIQGDPANDLLMKYRDKADVFKGIVETIEEGERHMGIQSTKFTDMIGTLHSNMK